MTNLPFAARDRAELYAQQHKLTIHEPPLGGGFDGIVLATDRGSAIKSMNNVQLYRQELDVYRYLQRKQIFEIGEFHIPKLLRWDDAHAIIEMTIVTPPYVVDFAGARLKQPQRFDEEIMQEWRQQKREEFGDDWPRVNVLIYAFQQRGVYLTDVHPRNVACR